MNALSGIPYTINARLSGITKISWQHVELATPASMPEM
jgi:hypothetical protein